MGKDFTWMDETSFVPAKTKTLSRFHLASLAHTGLMVVIFLIGIVAIARGDHSAHVSGDDSKELVATRSTTDEGFQPLPGWARDATMPALPQVLKPMGTKVAILTTPPVAAHQALTPPPEPALAVVKPTPTPVAAPQPTVLVAVSPFLQWIKANPQAAAAQAHDQAGIYQGAPDAAGTVTPPPGSPGNPPAPVASGTTPGASEAPYWMPPLIDSSTFSSGSTTTGSSAAIYTTPQR